MLSTSPAEGKMELVAKMPSSYAPKRKNNIALSLIDIVNYSL